MDNDFKVLLQAVIDASGIGKSSLDEIQKVLNKYHLNLTADLDKAKLLKTIKQVAPQIEKELKEITGIDIKISDESLIKSINQITRDAERAASKLKEVQFKMDNGHGVSEYQNRIKSLVQDFEKYGVSTKQAENETLRLQEIFGQMKTLSGQELISEADKIEQEFKAVKVSVDEAKFSYDKFSQPVSNEKATSLINRINTFLTKNTRITKEARAELEGFISEINRGVNANRWNEINGSLKKTENSMRGLGRLGASFKNQMEQAATSFAQWLSVSSAVMLMVSNTREAVTELKNLDSILTEISKTSDLTESQLKKVGKSAFPTASEYGKKASDYLTGVREMYRAGFKNAEKMAELSVLTQSAGDMNIQNANDYLMATNAAYKYKESIEELNKVLDSQNYITNNSAVNMQDMADATSEAASVASEYRVGIDELSALIATVVSKTRESGSEAGTAIKSLFINLQDTTSKPVVEAFNSVGISMTKMVDGSERLKTPIELLKELSAAFKSLPDGDIRKANILTDIGKKYHANTLAAILSDWSNFEDMLKLYSDPSASGSALREAEKSANNLEGSLNRLNNTWTDTVGNIANADILKNGVNFLNELLGVVNKLTDSLGSVGSIGAITGVVLNKRLGRNIAFLSYQG